MDKLIHRINSIWNNSPSVKLQTVLKWISISLICVYFLAMDPMRFVIGRTAQASFKVIKDTISNDASVLYDKLMLILSTDEDLIREISQLSDDLEKLKFENNHLSAKLDDASRTSNDLVTANESLKKDVLDAQSHQRSLSSELESERIKRLTEEEIAKTFNYSKSELAMFGLIAGTIAYKIWMVYMGYGPEFASDNHAQIVAMLIGLSKTIAANKEETPHDKSRVEELDDAFSPSDIIS